MTLSQRIATGMPREILRAPLIGRIKRRYFWALNGVTTIGLAAMAAQLASGSVGWSEVAIFAVFLVVCGLGITVGFHRLFAHRAFETTPTVKAVLAVAGSMAGQGALISWVSIHRCHHKYTDRDGDPHSPIVDADRPLSGLSGLWHSHMGWLTNDSLPNSAAFAKDLLADKLAAGVSRRYLECIALGIVTPAIVDGLVHLSWYGALSGLVWGGIGRLFFTAHSGWAVNSIGHTLGRRPFGTMDRSGNSFLLAVFTFGEGWHNNHHARPRSACFSSRALQVDLGYLAIKLLEATGLAWNVVERTGAALRPVEEQGGR